MTTPQKVWLKDYRAPDFECEQVTLHFKLDSVATEVTAKLKLARHPEASDGAPLVLDGESLVLKSLRVDGVEWSPDRYEVTDSHLLLREVPSSFELETIVQINPEANHALSGLYLSNGNFCTQCESEGFRRITYFLDRPDVMSHFQVTIEADRDSFPQLLCNGNLIEQIDLPGGLHRVTWEDPSLKPCYLFALVAGDFDCQEGTFTTMTGREVSLRFYVEKGFLDQVPHALWSLQQAMAWDERAYGRAYDLDIYMVVAVSDFNFGAMENKGLNIFNTKYVLAHPAMATDQDYLNVLAVIGHEYFHNWSGNRVTCRDWFQISLKEGFTVFREHGFVADHVSQGAKRIEDAALIVNQQFAEDRGPMAHPVRPESYIEINNFYTLTVYHKGAELIRMMALILGESTFRKATDLYFSRHDGQAVTCEDFVKAMEDASGVDLQQFRLWYSVAGTPEVVAKGVYDEAQQRYTLTLTQQAPDSTAKPMHIPVQMALMSCTGEPQQLHAASDDAGVSEQCLHLTSHEQSFCFHRVTSRPIPSLLRGFSAPVILKTQLSHDDLQLLWLSDSDPYKRWESWQSLAVEAIYAYGSKAFETAVNRLRTGLEIFLRQPLDDLQLQTRLMTLPAEAYVVMQREATDVHHVLAGHRALRIALGNALKSGWVQYYQQLNVSEPYGSNMAAVAKRSMKNLCLQYAGFGGDSDVLSLAHHQFLAADNLTDRWAALLLLNDHVCAFREDDLRTFYGQGEGQALLRDRWFQLQGVSRLPDAVSRVRALTSHQDFHWHNPNRVRSLIASFASQNLPAFHDLSGAGYRLLAEVVLKMDAINPQTAARLTEPLTRWGQYADAQAKPMCGALKSIASHVGLSKGVFEVVSHSLELTES